MKTAEWYQRGCSGDFIVKLEKKIHFCNILRLDKWIPDGSLFSKNLLTKQAI